MDKRTIVLCLIFAFLVVLNASRWKEVGYDYWYSFHTYDELFSSAEAVNLPELITIFTIYPGDKYPEAGIQVIQYDRDRLTGQKRSTFSGTSYYGKPTSGGIVSYENPFLVHGMTALLYVAMFAIGIDLFIRERYKGQVVILLVIIVVNLISCFWTL